MSSQAVSGAVSAIRSAKEHLSSRCLFAKDLSRHVLILSAWALLAFSLVALQLKVMHLAVFASPMRQVSARVTYLADPFVRTLASLAAADAAIATCDAARLVGPVLVLALGAVGACTILRCIDEAARSTVGAEACK